MHRSPALALLSLGIAEQGAATLRELGTAGVIEAQDADSLGIAFEDAAGKTRDSYEKYYLLAYCSPARSGTRRLKVEVRFRDPFSSPPRMDPEPRTDTPAEDESVAPPPNKPGYSP